MCSRKSRVSSCESTDSETEDDEVPAGEVLNSGLNFKSDTMHKVELVSVNENRAIVVTENDGIVNEMDSITCHHPSNPLIVGIVLDNVFRNLSLDLEMLKVCRTVCSTWHEAATKHFRKRAICIPMKYSSPYYHENPTLASKLYTKRSDTTSVCDPLNDSIYKGFFHQALPSVLPFENIYITENIKGSKENRVSMSDAVVTKWFRDWGPHMRGIRLKLKTFHNKDKMSPFLASILTQGCVNMEELELLGICNLSFQEFNLEKGQLSKIKKLILRDKRTSSLSESCKIGVLSQVESIFAAAPNVESIVLDIEDHDWAQAFAKLIVESFQKLNSLEWSNNLYEKHVRELEKMPKEVLLKNIYLNCKIVPQAGNFLAIKRFLAKFTKSLEIFRITGEVAESSPEGLDSESDSDIDLWDDQPPIGFEFFERDFPHLEKLIVLDMGNIRHSRLNKFNVLQKFPNLEKLILRKASSDYYHTYMPIRDNFPYFQNEPMAVLEPHMNLKEFHLEPEVRMRDFVSTLSFVFPNLKVLHVCVHSERIFAEVFRTMRSLEELNLKFKTTEFPRCNSALSGSLLNMTDLKRLTLEHLGPYPFQLTENTVSSGMKQAKNLRWLHLINFAVCQSERNSILEHLKHYVTVKFTNCVIQSPPLNAVYGILSSVDPFLSKQSPD